MRGIVLLRVERTSLGWTSRALAFTIKRVSYIGCEPSGTTTSETTKHTFNDDRI